MSAFKKKESRNCISACISTIEYGELIIWDFKNGLVN